MDIHHSQVRRFNSHDSIIRIVEVQESSCEVLYEYPDGLEIVGNLIHIADTTHEVDSNLFERKSEL